MAFDEREPAGSTEQKIRRAGAHTQVGIGASEEHEARLVKTGCYRDRVDAVGAVHVIRKTHGRK